MSMTNRVIAFLFVVVFVAGTVTPISYNIESMINIDLLDAQKTPSSTNFVVNVQVLNEPQDFNDDDFKFTVLNGTVPLANAWIRLLNITTEVLEDDAYTDGNGEAWFHNLAVGTYRWNITHEDDPDAFETGQIISNGPEANVDILFGNVDWENDQDDLSATITDIEDRPANNLNFSILHTANNSIWAQTEVVDGNAYFQDIPDGTYVWELRVLYDITYAGYLLDSGALEANSTQLLAHWSNTTKIGDPYYYDLEVFTYYETSLAPISGALVNVTFKNGTEWASQYTPTNGTVLFVDLPQAFMNWTVTLGGVPVGDGYYHIDYTTAGSDVRAPTILSPGDQDVLYDSENVTITWHVEDTYPDTLTVYVDNVLNCTVDWVNSTYDYVFNVSAAFDVFNIGTYEIKLVATDQHRNSAFDIISLRFYENVTPIIYGPDDIEFLFTLTGYSLTWNMSDDFLNTYSLTRNGVVVASGTIDSDEPVITYNLDGLSIGVYNFTLLIDDTSGNIATDEVTVTVLADETAPILVFAPDDIYYNQGDTGIIRNWTVTDDFKNYYTIEIDGEMIVTEDWISENIEFDFSGLRMGQYQVKLTAYDICGNSIESIVNVHVSEAVITRYITWISIISVGVIVLIAAVWFIRYR